MVLRPFFGMLLAAPAGYGEGTSNTPTVTASISPTTLAALSKAGVSR